MKTRLLLLSLAVVVGVLSMARPAAAQDEHRKFDDHDRQVVNTWYGTHKAAPPVGLRDRDRLSADVEAKFDVGLVLNADLRGRVHTIPVELQHQLPAAPRGCRYVFIGGHLVLIDAKFTVLDVIHLH